MVVPEYAHIVKEQYSDVNTATLPTGNWFFKYGSVRGQVEARNKGKTAFIREGGRLQLGTVNLACTHF